MPLVEKMVNQTLTRIYGVHSDWDLQQLSKRDFTNAVVIVSIMMIIFGVLLLMTFFTILWCRCYSVDVVNNRLVIRARGYEILQSLDRPPTMTNVSNFTLADPDAHHSYANGQSVKDWYSDLFISIGSIVVMLNDSSDGRLNKGDLLRIVDLDLQQNTATGMLLTNRVSVSEKPMESKDASANDSLRKIHLDQVTLENAAAMPIN